MSKRPLAFCKYHKHIHLLPSGTQDDTQQLHPAARHGTKLGLRIGLRCWQTAYLVVERIGMDLKLRPSGLQKLQDNKEEGNGGNGPRHRLRKPAGGALSHHSTRVRDFPQRACTDASPRRRFLPTFCPTVSDALAPSLACPSRSPRQCAITPTRLGAAAGPARRRCGMGGGDEQRPGDAPGHSCPGAHAQGPSRAAGRARAPAPGRRGAARAGRGIGAAPAERGRPRDTASPGGQLPRRAAFPRVKTGAGGPWLHRPDGWRAAHARPGRGRPHTSVHRLSRRLGCARAGRRCLCACHREAAAAHRGPSAPGRPGRRGSPPGEAGGRPGRRRTTRARRGRAAHREAPSTVLRRPVPSLPAPPARPLSRFNAQGPEGRPRAVAPHARTRRAPAPVRGAVPRERTARDILHGGLGHGPARRLHGLRARLLGRSPRLGAAPHTPLRRLSPVWGSAPPSLRPCSP
ncbi:hypothetical protein HPG69_007889 [Diceros bicornis minor]|uniref:Uncharacterized protein n=1 Tax=Diceros bicornis minor TaxID=77932 RepID=A0A7J7EBW6_DICBM|nr:hypothetical protein HPG69_007889 [Diceros bicornis minor]